MKDSVAKTTRFRFVASLLGMLGVVKAQDAVPAPTAPKRVPGEIWQGADEVWVYMDDAGMTHRIDIGASGTTGKLLTPPSIPISSGPIMGTNGICPVCSTKAPAYRRTWFDDGPGMVVTMEPDSRLERCKSCNVAFYQDAEGAK